MIDRTQTPVNRLRYIHGHSDLHSGISKFARRRAFALVHVKLVRRESQRDMRCTCKVDAISCDFSSGFVDNMRSRNDGAKQL